MTDRIPDGRIPLFDDSRVIRSFWPQHGESARQLRTRLRRLEGEVLTLERFAREVDDPTLRERAVRIRELLSRHLAGEDFRGEPIVWKSLYRPTTGNDMEAGE